jgi:hypothetical protein
MFVHLRATHTLAKHRRRIFRLASPARLGLEPQGPQRLPHVRYSTRPNQRRTLSNSAHFILLVSLGSHRRIFSHAARFLRPITCANSTSRGYHASDSQVGEDVLDGEARCVILRGLGDGATDVGLDDCVPRDEVVMALVAVAIDDTLALRPRRSGGLSPPLIDFLCRPVLGAATVEARVGQSPILSVITLAAGLAAHPSANPSQPRSGKTCLSDVLAPVAFA